MAATRPTDGESSLKKSRLKPSANDYDCIGSKDVRFDQLAEALGCYGEHVEREEDIGAAIKRAYASGRPGGIHVPIDPKVNSGETPNYDEFTTWYAEG